MDVPTVSPAPSLLPKIDTAPYSIPSVAYHRLLKRRLDNLARDGQVECLSYLSSRIRMLRQRTG